MFDPRIPARLRAAAFLLLTTLTAFWFSVPARAQIDVTGPSTSAARSLQSWYEHHMPARFRARSPLLIRELNDAQMNAYLDGNEDGAQFVSGDSPSGSDDGNGDIDGVFESDPDRIALRLPPAGKIDIYTFAHEYGHYVWFAFLSQDDRKRYEAVYNHQLAAHRLVTRYAATSLEEGFAEAFSFYAADPLILAHRDPASYQFLIHWSGKGRF